MIVRTVQWLRVVDNLRTIKWPNASDVEELVAGSRR
jgi:hypothetical protein